RSSDLRQFFRLRLVSKRNLTRINTVYLNGYDSSLTISVYFIETFFAKYLLQACDMPSDTRIERPTVRLLFVYTNRFSFFFRIHKIPPSFIFLCSNVIYRVLRRILRRGLIPLAR